MVGDVATGVAKLTNSDDDDNWDPNWSGAADIGSAGLGIAKLAGVQNIPGWAGGALQGIGGAAEAYNRFTQAGDESDPTKKGKLENQAWSAAGDAGFGALNIVGSVLGGEAEVVIQGTEVVLNGAGMISNMMGGDDAKFSAADAMGGAMRALMPEDTESLDGISDALGGSEYAETAELVAKGGVALGQAPLALLDAGAGALVNTVGNIVDSDRETSDDYYGQAKSYLTSVDPSAIMNAVGHMAA